MKIAHVINPVKVKESSDLFIAQPVTFKSMAVARSFAMSQDSGLQIELMTTQYPEDREIIPSWFRVLDDLEKSVLDHGSFASQRKLPLIKDILGKAHDASAGADYLIYSNADIALMPQFYLFVQDMIKRGHDALIINRRTISKNFSLPDQLFQMYSEIGKPHPGYDCFVFSSESFKRFALGNACIGANWIGRVLYGNIVSTCSNLHIEKEAHLTFHLGDDGAWLTGNYNDFDQFNKAEAYRVITHLQEREVNPDKVKELSNIISFMDTWGKPKQISTNKSLAQKAIQKIKRIIK